jgi:hypothetical protein
MDRTELPLEPHHLGVPSSASKTISMPTVCSVQTGHLSCTDSNTVPKRTKSRFHTTHVTYEFYWVRPKLFMSLWYVQCKRCTYLASRLALSPNRPNRAPLVHRHLGVPSAASKTIYEPMERLTQTEHLRYIRHKSCTNLAPRVALSPNGRNRASTCASSPRSLSSASKMISMPMYVRCKLCTYLALPLTLSPNRLK